MLGPDAKTLGTLTEPREFNLMFKTYVGALSGEEGAAFLRPGNGPGHLRQLQERAGQLAACGCRSASARSARAFATRSRRGISPSARASSSRWRSSFSAIPTARPPGTSIWRDRRYRWYLDLGLAGDRLRLRDHDQDELSHYSCGTADIEYAFPFLPPGEFGELEGDRPSRRLRSAQPHGGQAGPQGRASWSSKLDADGKPRHRGSGKDLSYCDDLTNERYVPHVIEPSAGADRATLAFLCEAYPEDEAPDENGKPAKRVVMRLHPRLAPIKAAVFPLVKKDGMPEVAQEIYGELKRRIERLLRRERGGRPPLPPPGRGRHAVLHHRRRPNADRRHRHHPRPRLAGAVAGEEGRLSGGADRAVAGVLRILLTSGRRLVDERAAIRVPLSLRERVGVRGTLRRTSRLFRRTAGVAIPHAAKNDTSPKRKRGTEQGPQSGPSLALRASEPLPSGLLWIIPFHTACSITTLLGLPALPCKRKTGRSG